MQGKCPEFPQNLYCFLIKIRTLTRIFILNEPYIPERFLNITTGKYPCPSLLYKSEGRFYRISKYLFPCIHPFRGKDLQKS